ncbi:MAG TPA: helix-turn-helix domain-containing protein [Acidimicrobiia bacterium]|nr:helix-turn-helix domain-containing protein [Acidimicrobiia bacterium]
MTARGEQTKKLLLDTAEQLFSERGFDAVSLREIRLAAGARNTAAMQFHWGDRDGLVDALIERHMPRIAAIQQDLYDRMVAEGRDHDLRSQVEVLVRPSAEYLTLGPGERAWVKIMADLSSAPDLYARDMRALAPKPALDISILLFGELEKRMPRAIAAERMVLLAQNAVQICAARARIEERQDVARPHLSMSVFVENLVDMIHGALFAPVSEALAERLNDVRPDATAAAVPERIPTS